jgi:AcrR family transcriptional regulator
MAQKQSKEFRIENILLAAIDEFTQKGYDGASIDAIAAKAGVSKGGFYYHFANKENLLMEVNNKINEPIYEMASKALQNTNPIKGLTQYIIDYLGYWIARPKELSFLFLSMSKSLESPALTEYYKQYVDSSSAFFSCMFKKIKESEKADIQNPELSGISLMGSLDGIISYAIVHPDIHIETMADQLIAIWLKNKTSN